MLLDIDECSSQPCLNGGTCTDQVNKYVCICRVGYTGINCQTGLSNLSCCLDILDTIKTDSESFSEEGKSIKLPILLTTSDGLTLLVI